MRYRRVFVRELLQVVWQDHASHCPFGVCNPDRAIDKMTNLLGDASHADKFTCDVLEQVLQVHFLLVARAKGCASLLAHQCNHRHVIELGIVEAIEQMDRPGSGRRIAKAHLTGEFGMCGSHEGGHLLMAHLDIFHDVLCLLQRDVQTTDSIAGIAVNTFQSPL